MGVRGMAHNAKGVALIIVIFAMMVFAILGWTLTVMQSIDFEANLRNYDSERALSLSEAGAQWMLNQLSINTCSRTRLGVIDTNGCNTVDTDCNDAGDWLNVPHTLGLGQYNICCRNPLGTESGNAVIESRGFIPAQLTPRSTREVKVEITIGNFNRVLSAKNLFNWNGVIAAGSQVTGTAQAGFYNRDNDAVYNELGVDYDPLPLPVLPSGSGDRLVASTPYPLINMSYYETQAGANTWNPPRTAVITSISEVDAGESRIVVSSNIFSNPRVQWEGQALRNLTRGSWAAGNWGVIKDCLGPGNSTVDLTSVVSWSVGDRVCIVPRISAISWVGDTATVDFACNYFEAPLAQWVTADYVCALRNFRGSAGWGYSEWGVIRTVPSANRTTVRIDASALPGTWVVGDWMGVVRRYRRDQTSAVNIVRYIKGDTLFDIRVRQIAWEPVTINGNIQFSRIGLVSEGDIVIRGPQQIRFFQSPTTYPNLATKNSNVYSPDAPAVLSYLRRNFSGGLIYSENGTITFNYLYARGVCGNDVTLSGRIFLVYNPTLLSLVGFTWGLSDIKWGEQ